MAVAVDEKAFWPSCVRRSKPDVTDAAAAVCSLSSRLGKPAVAAALHHAVHQLRHAVLQLQHAAQLQLQHQHAVQLQQQLAVAKQLLHHPAVVQLLHHLSVVVHDLFVQLQAAVATLLLQFRPDAALAEQLWMLAQSAPEPQHQQHQPLQQQ